MPAPSLRVATPLLLAALLACARSAQQAPPPSPETAEAAAARMTSSFAPAVITGFSGPEAVRFDPEQEIWFVANFNGQGDALDDNGFISRVRADGQIETLRWVDGAGEGVTLHAPRGMALVGDTLWVADVDAVRAFHRRTGAPLADVSFAGMDVGFLNDVAPGPDGAVYVTDTGRDRIYRVVAGRPPEVALADSALGRPNGITWDSAGARFLVVPFGGAHVLHAWRPGTTTLEPVATSPGARFDGVEVLPGGRILVASQADSSVHLIEGDSARVLFRTEGRPADIGVDVRRMRVAVPYIALNRVDIWPIERR